MRKNILTLGLAFTCALNSLFAQLNDTYSLDLSDVVSIPVFDGVNLSDTISATSFDITLVQSLTSSKITSVDSSISASEFDAYEDGTLILDFDAPVSFTSTVTLAGNIARLVGAKVTILKGATGSGTATDDKTGENYDVTVSGVTGGFNFKSLSADVDAGQIQGVIAPGSVKITGFVTDLPRKKATVTAKYGQQDFGPYDFDSSNLISPTFDPLTLATSAKGAVTGSATGTFGDFDDVSFSVKGKRNAKSGVSTLTLTSTSVKGITATLNLDDDGNLTGTKNSLNVLGYKLKF